MFFIIVVDFIQWVNFCELKLYHMYILKQMCLETLQTFDVFMSRVYIEEVNFVHNLLLYFFMVEMSVTWNSNKSTFCQFDPSSARMFQDLLTCYYIIINRWSLLLLEHLEFWNTISICISARSLLQVKQTSNWSFKPRKCCNQRY